MNRTRLLPTLLALLAALALSGTVSALLVQAQPEEAAPESEVVESEAQPVEPSAEPTTGDEAAGEAPIEVDETPITVDAMLETVGTVFSDTPPWAWAVLIAGILAGLIVGRVLQATLKRMSHSAMQRNHAVRADLCQDVSGPAGLAILTLGIQTGMLYVRLPGGMAPFADSLYQFFYFLSLAWFVFNLVDIVDIAIKRRVTGAQSALAAQITPLIRKTLRIFVVIIFILFIAQNVFGVDITAWLAGLGIAGLAISLASQDSVRNLFGSITVMLDKPFLVGDRIVLDKTDGVVEEIGLRSTRIRTSSTGHLVTVPNMRFIDGTVENISLRPYFRRSLDVTIACDTPPAKVAEAVRIIRELLEADDLCEPFHLDTDPPRVYFNDFNAESLNISVMYWYYHDASKGRDWWDFQRHGETFNNRLFAAFAEAGIEFAFPTRTLFLAGDPARALSVTVAKDQAEA